MRKKTISAIMLATFASTAAIAQSSSSPAPEAGAAGETGIDDIIVTARKLSERAQSIPLSISAFNASKLTDLSLQNINDVSRQTPSLYTNPASTDSNALFLSLRGQTQSDILLTNESSVGVYVDGVYLPRQFGLGAALVDIERIEVLKGPQGTLYGKNTTGGAISITSRQPDLQRFGGFADVVLGNYDRNDFTGALNVPIVADKLALRVLAQQTRRDGFGKDALGRYVSIDHGNTYRGIIRFEPSERFHASVEGDYTRLRGNGAAIRLSSVAAFPTAAGGFRSALTSIARQRGLVLPGTATPDLVAAYALFSGMLGGPAKFQGSFTDFPQISNYKGYGVSGRASFDVTDLIQIKSITANRWAHRPTNNDYDASPYDFIRTFTDTTSKTFSQELQIASQNGLAFDWIVGGYYAKETGTATSIGNQFSPSASNPIYTDGDVKNTTAGVFGQVNVKITDTVRLTGGLRYTDEGKDLYTRNRNGLGCNVPVSLRINGQCLAFLSDSFKKWSYLASADWRPNQDTLLYVKTSRGFKGGGQNFKAVNADGFFAFKPEVVTDYETGAKIDLFERRLRANVALYVSKLKDAQRSTNTFIGGVIQPLTTNAASADIKGVELELTAKPVEALTLSATGGLTDAKYNRFVDVTGDRTNEDFVFPKWTYTLSATYAVPVAIGVVKFVVDWDYRSKVNNYPTSKIESAVTQRGFGLLNSRAAFNLDKYDMSIAVFGKNVLNKHYAATAIGFESLGYNTIVPGAPRTIGVQLTKRFGGG